MPKGLAALALAMAIAASALAQPRPPVINSGVQAAAPKSFPQVGDSWTYLLTTHRPNRTPEKSSVLVRVTASSAEKIVDEVSRDGDEPYESVHSPGNAMVLQAVSVFSPYLAVFYDLQPGDPIQRVYEHDVSCHTWVDCVTHGRIEGRETLQLAAGSFDTIKVTLEQTISRRRGFAPRFTTAQDISYNVLTTRTLTIWYSPAAKRAVKVVSRISSPHRRMVFHASFDLELMSYQLR